MAAHIELRDKNGDAIDSGNPLPVSIAAGTAVVGRVGIDQTTPGTTNRVLAGGLTPRLAAQYVRAANATQYDIGDLIGNSTTAASVVPIEFTPARLSGRLTGARCVLSAASGTIVLPNFFLWLFRSTPDIPFAAGSYPADNAALNIGVNAMKDAIGVLRFSATDWINQAGGSSAAGGHVYQAVGFNSQPVTSPRPFAPFNLEGLATQKILGLMQVQSAWNPGNVAQTFDFALDADLD